MEFAHILKNLMNEKHLSNYELAKGIGSHQTTIAYWLSGEREPHKKNLKKLADYFNVSVNYLNGETDIKEKAAPISGNGLSDIQQRMIDWVMNATPEQLQTLYDFLQRMK